MSLTIQNEETHRLAVQLAALTGEPLTTAITVAIQERLARLQQQRHVEEIIARAQEIIQRSGGAAPYTNHADLLYDEHGLPQ